MSNLLKVVDRARDALDVTWSPERATSIVDGIAGKRRRRLVIRGAVGSALVLLALGVFGLRSLTGPRVDAPAGLDDPRTIAFDDGSVAMALTAETRLVPLTLSESSIRVELLEGKARFEVTRRPQRRFEVLAGAVTVEVVGTVFIVERTQREVHVSVERGSVRVRGPGGDTSVPAGQSLSQPAVTATAAQPSPQAPSAQPTREPRAPSRAPAAPVWRDLAHRGEYARAYEELSHRGGTAAVEDSVDDLLLSADVARLSHNAAAALDPLRRIVHGHRGDNRAPLAAFTLGRILLDELGDPAGAAAAFADVLVLEPNGAMAEDALARQVESNARAGDAGAAHALALEFQLRFPTGRRLRAVQRWGRIE